VLLVFNCKTTIFKHFPDDCHTKYMMVYYACGQIFRHISLETFFIRVSITMAASMCSTSMSFHFPFQVMARYW